MRDYKYIDSYIVKLYEDIYPQPVDGGHMDMAENILHKWLPKLTPKENVIDMGCGATAFCKNTFEHYGVKYTGVTLGQDVITCRGAGIDVIDSDFSFMTAIPNNTFDLVFARHSLEHSPMPIITLMEWRRICRNWAIIVLPNPAHYGWGGLNHYSVANDVQALWWFERAGWEVLWRDYTEKTELRYMMRKV